LIRICEVVAVENQVRRGLSQVCEDRFKGGLITVNVGDNCNAKAPALEKASESSQDGSVFLGFNIFP
jgi:hypothetical protein